MNFTRTFRQIPSLAAAVFVLLGSARSAAIVETDICVYGGTSGGVIAAVQAERLGKTAALVVFNNHLGGMTSGGLGETDLGGFPDAIQGLSRGFYRRVGAKYGESGAKFRFEPKVAEAVFDEMMAESGVPIYFNRRLKSVEMNGGRIVSITMENGDVFRAKMFIDCTYEGDLLAKAGVSYTVGREPNSQYGETLNGIQAARATGNQLPNGIDPYVVPGDPSSGLLPGVNPDAGGSDGAGDARVQAFCYRMCLTDRADNRVMIGLPEGYDEADYEILFRAIEAGQSTLFWKTDRMPNDKTDSNNASGISCDFIGGGSDEWAEASYARRFEIERAHERWQRGLVWTVQNHPRVPPAIRNAWSRWGLPKDEFLDTGHWPHQLYVREARRMISDYVMLQQNCVGTRVAEDSVGLACYTMDSHNVQRHVRNGMVKNEGDVQVAVPRPYPISYRSIVPKTGECENLFVTFALSASHMGFGSCRMEPVLMVVSQSAATAAAFAIDDEVSVQNVDYGKLSAQLRMDGQLLTWDASVSPDGVVVDNADAARVTTIGEWLSATSVAGFRGADYIHDNNQGKGSKSVEFRPRLGAPGVYEVFARWTAYANRASNAPIDIVHANGTSTVLVNQRQQGGQWVSLGTFTFGPEAAAVVRTAGTNGYVIADAFQFARRDLPTISVWASNGSAREPLTDAGAGRQGVVVVSRTGSTASPLAVDVEIGGTATNGGDYALRATTVTIPAGAGHALLTIEPKADRFAEGPETVVVRVVDSAGWAADPLLNEARVRIDDRPYDAWRKAVFTPNELDDPSVSADDADFDGDGANTMLEFLVNGSPVIADFRGVGNLATVSVAAKSHLTLTFTRAKAADVAGIPQVSGDLVEWRWGPGAVAETVIADDGNTQTIEARDLTPMEDDSKRFIRLFVRRAL